MRREDVEKETGMNERHRGAEQRGGPQQRVGEGARGVETEVGSGAEQDPRSRPSKAIDNGSSDRGSSSSSNGSSAATAAAASRAPVVDRVGKMPFWSVKGLDEFCMRHLQGLGHRVEDSGLRVEGFDAICMRHLQGLGLGLKAKGLGYRARA
jgi:hypothetical protein